MRRLVAHMGLVGAIVGAIVGAMLVATAAPAAAASLLVSPTAVPTAGTVTVSGDVLVNGQRGCAVGDDVTVISNAFVGYSEFAGMGAVQIPTDASGHFSMQVTLKSSVAPGVYEITARCGGGNLGVSATLTVTGLPRTGASTGPLSWAALALCGLGVVLAGFGRRRALL